MFIVILFMAPCLLLLKELDLPVGPPDVVPQFLEILGISGYGYQFWGKSESDINGESGLFSVH